MGKNVKDKSERVYRYDFSIKTKDERAEFIEGKIGYLLELPPYMLMGYSNKSRESDDKYNKIPRMIDRYTSYYLQSKDIESSKSTEYRYYIDEHDDIMRKNNRVLYHESSCFDGGVDGEGETLTNYSEVYRDEEKSFIGHNDYSFESEDSAILIYAIKSGNLSVKDYKKILYMSSDILIKSKDEELKSEIEQVVFNCVLNTQDERDVEILREYTTGASLREVAEKVGLSHVSVSKRLNNILKWV